MIPDEEEEEKILIVRPDYRAMLAEFKMQRNEIVETYQRTLQRLDEVIAMLEQAIKRTTQ